MDSRALQFVSAALRVSEKRISSVDNDVAFFQQRRDLLDDGVNRRARLYHDHCFARARQRTDEFLDRTRRLNRFILSAPGRKLVRHLSSTVKDRNRESLGVHVQDEIFAHYRETDEANIALIPGHFRISLSDASTEETYSNEHS